MLNQEEAKLTSRNDNKYFKVLPCLLQLWIDLRKPAGNSGQKYLNPRSKYSAGSLNQGDTTASSEPILKSAHTIAIFKRKMAVVSQKHLRNTHWLGSSSHLPLPVSL